MLSTAADRSLREVDFAVFKEKKVFVDAVYFESYDKGYVLGTLRNLLSINGALLATNASEAEVIIEPRSGALSIDSSQSLIGMPSLPVPIPFAGTLVSPEIALWRSQKLFSTAKIALFAYEQKSHRHFYSTGPLIGRASHRYYRFLGYIASTRTDIPEKKELKSK